MDPRSYTQHTHEYINENLIYLNKIYTELHYVHIMCPGWFRFSVDFAYKVRPNWIIKVDFYKETFLA